MILREAIEQRAKARPTVDVDLSSFLSDAPAGLTIKMRALSVAESDESTRAAVEYRKSMIAQLPEKYVREFLEDPTFLEDAKNVERLWRSARDAEDVGKPAFISAQWMRENFTTDELQVMFGHFQRASVPDDAFTDEQLESLVDICVFRSDTTALMALSKPTLARLFIRLALKTRAA